MAHRLNDTHVTFDQNTFDNRVMAENNYTISDSGIFTNGTNCYVVFGRYNATMLSNGTVFGTKCDAPIHSIYIRGGLGIAFGVLFVLMIIFGMTGLRKHGQLHLPLDRNFRPIGRRWQWYWLLVSATVAVISGFTAVDIDRVSIQGTSLILHNLFYYCMLPTILASIWEMTRHWGSFCERQLTEEDAFRFLHGDRRYKIELYMPMPFYLFAFLTFFLSILRSWTPIPRGDAEGIAAATDARFKASAFMAFFAWVVIVCSIFVTKHYYQPVAGRMPWKIPACLALVLIRVVYNLAVAWEYDISPMKQQVPEAIVFCLGYIPVWLVMLVMVVAAYTERNDDYVIRDIRASRHRKMDGELGIGPGMPVMMKPVKAPSADSGVTTGSTDKTLAEDKTFEK